MTADLHALGEQLVRERIGGTRKGSLEPAYEHSLRVAGRLERHGYGEEVVLAGLLHDIVEDGYTSLDELSALGYSPRTVRLVDLSSHDEGVLGKDRRWAHMVARLEVARDAEAWAVKVSDLIDNLAGSITLPPGRRAVFFELKGPTYLALTWPLLGETALWPELLRACTAPGMVRYRELAAG